MTTLIAEVYDALKEAGATEAKAKAAAEALAGYVRQDERLARVEADIKEVKTDLAGIKGGQQDITMRLVRVETTLQLLVRIQYGLLAAAALILLRLFLFWPGAAP